MVCFGFIRRILSFFCWRCCCYIYALSAKYKFCASGTFKRFDAFGQDKNSDFMHTIYVVDFATAPLIYYFVHFFSSFNKFYIHGWRMKTGSNVIMTKCICMRLFFGFLFCCYTCFLLVLQLLQRKVQ